MILSLRGTASPSLRFTQLLSNCSISQPIYPPPGAQHSTSPASWPALLSQSADCLLSHPARSAHHPRPQLPSSGLFSSGGLLHHSLPQPLVTRLALIHKLELTASVRINLVTSTGLTVSSKERETHINIKNEAKEQSFSYEIFHFTTPTSAKRLSNKSARPWTRTNTPSFYARDIRHTSNTRCPSGIFSGPPSVTLTDSSEDKSSRFVTDSTV